MLFSLPSRFLASIVLLFTLASAFDISSLCSRPLLSLPATFAFLPQHEGSRDSTMLTSSIDLFDVFPVSRFYDRLNWRVLVNGSSSPRASLVHERNTDGDVWTLRLRLHDSTLSHSQLRLIMSLGHAPALETCVEMLQSLAVPACVLDVWIQGPAGEGGVSAVLSQSFVPLPLLAGAAAATSTASHGLYFVSPVGGSSFSSNMQLLLLLHIDSLAAASSSRWLLQVSTVQQPPLANIVSLLLLL
jgi:hypothetical protein